MKQEQKTGTQTLEETKRQLRAQMEELAARSPYRLNPKPAVVEDILEGLARNVLELGCAYCTCKVPTGVPEDDKSIICPCAALAEEVKEYGHCDCALFVAGSSGQATV